MINLKEVTQAIESILNASPYEFHVERNAERNTDPNVAAVGDGWVGIYRGSNSLKPLALRRWLAAPTIDVELQVMDTDPGLAENRLQDGETALLTIFTDNLTLDPGTGGTVDMIKEFDTEYQFNADTEQGVYFHSAIVTLSFEQQVQL